MVEAGPQPTYEEKMRVPPWARAQHLPFIQKKKNIRKFKHPPKIFEILATPKISPILYLDLKKRL